MTLSFGNIFRYSLLNDKISVACYLSCYNFQIVLHTCTTAINVTQKQPERGIQERNRMARSDQREGRLLCVVMVICRPQYSSRDGALHELVSRAFSWRWRCDCCPDYDDVGAGVDPNVRADSLTSPGPEDLNKTFCFSCVGSMLGFIIFSSKNFLTLD